ncbi:MAG TPA: hypothetical protein VD859_02405 [Nocardioides sp.]|nr:hypothetical protein [Nocardioides sp.]
MNRPAALTVPARRWVLRLLLVLAPAALLGVGLAAASSAGPGRHEPAPDTIVFVEGDAAHGFGILRHDGTWIYPPTKSETHAECGEHDKLIDRVRCRVEARTWFRELGEMQRTISYYRAELRED